MKFLLITALSFAGIANAQQIDNWTNSSGQPWKNSAGQCWRNSSWTPATAHPDCDGALKPDTKVAEVSPKELAKKPNTPTMAARAPVEPNSVKVTLAGEALFDFDKAVIKPEGKVMLDNLISKINRELTVEVIIVVGHTDSVGTDAYNQKLGMRRANAVKTYFLLKGIESNRVYAESKGEKQPVADNKTAAGRAKNRRVEIEVVGATKK